MRALVTIFSLIPVKIPGFVFDLVLSATLNFSFFPFDENPIFLVLNIAAT